MTNCPECGGSGRDLVAPGYYRCTSIRIVGELSPGQYVPGECGSYYSDGSTSHNYCACGYVAIRRCSRCARHLCHRHGYFLKERTARYDSLHCEDCRDRRLEELHSNDLRSRRAARVRYDALPAIDETTLAAWIASEISESRFKDGVTHRANFKNRDIAQMIASKLGVDDYSFILSGKSGNRAVGAGATWVRRDPDPYLPGSRPGYVEPGLGVWGLSPDGTLTRGYGTWTSSRGHIDGGPPPETGVRRPEEQFNMASTGDIDLSAFLQLRSAYQWNLGNLFDRDREYRFREEKAAKERSQVPGCLVLFLILLLVLAIILAGLGFSTLMK